MSTVRLNLVVAACNNNGIGKNGELPWRLKKDMAFFKKITMETKLAGKQNAVIMGRKTWFSIPEKFRPLKGRINIVLSRELKELPEGVHLARSLQDAINLVTSKPLSEQTENVHIIGGSSVYKEAMTGPYDCRIYLTRIFKEFDCDTFLPTMDDSFQKVDNPAEIQAEVQTENDIEFQFEVYDKEKLNSDTNSRTDGRHCQDNAEATNTMDDHNSTLTFNVMAAMCHNNRGIANGQKLPWPSLREDVEWYLKHTSTPRYPDKMTDKKKIIHINGRNTFLAAGGRERSLPNVYYVTISKTLKESGFTHPKILQLVETFQDAVDYCHHLLSRDELDSVWVMGGQSVYKEALNHARCGKLFLTHVYADFPATVFFPAFEDRFQEITDEDADSTLKEDNGVQYQFKVYRVKVT